MASRIDIEKTRNSIAVILDKLKTDVDPHVLNEYREVFKKEISLFRRSWAAAYLLMYYNQGGSGFRSNQDVQVKGRKNRKAQPDKRLAEVKQDRVSDGVQENSGVSPRRPYPLADEDSRRIFIGVGRNRRVFPREILGLIIAKTGISRDDIGAIRILENYSFVQVRDTVAEQIIETLNGYVFRGRTLTVNFAKNRKEEAENSETAEQDDVFNDSGDYSEIDEYPDCDDSEQKQD